LRLQAGKIDCETRRLKASGKCQQFASPGSNLGTDRALSASRIAEAKRHEEKDIMKKIVVLLLAGLLTTTLGLATEPTPADQKWLEVVQNMVSKGEKKVTTPKEDRVTMVKDWAGKHGYLVKVTKDGNTFNIEFAAKESSKNIAQK
jgi:hypothetical protein